MSQHPLNLALRFLLELAALAAWGWSAAGGLGGLLLAVLAPAFAAFAWATFRVPGDPPHVTHPRIRVSGPVRLLVEAALFALAALALRATEAETLAAVLAVVVIIHYALSYDRVRALLALS